MICQTQCVEGVFRKAVRDSRCGRGPGYLHHVAAKVIWHTPGLTCQTRGSTVAHLEKAQSQWSRWATVLLLGSSGKEKSAVWRRLGPCCSSHLGSSRAHSLKARLAAWYSSEGVELSEAGSWEDTFRGHSGSLSSLPGVLGIESEASSGILIPSFLFCLFRPCH